MTSYEYQSWKETQGKRMATLARERRLAFAWRLFVIGVLIATVWIVVVMF